MFYTNKNLKVIEKDLEWEKLRFFQIGEYGRGRKPVNITVPETIGEHRKRMASVFDWSFEDRSSETY